MAKALADMTSDDLKQLIEETIEGKLIEILGDPDEGAEIQEALAERLRAQRRQVSEGERGESLEDVSRHLGLT